MKKIKNFGGKEPLDLYVQEEDLLDSGEPDREDLVGSVEWDGDESELYESVDETEISADADDTTEALARLRWLGKKRVISCKPTNNVVGTVAQILVLRCPVCKLELKNGQSCRNHPSVLPVPFSEDLHCPHCNDGLIRYDNRAERVCDSCKIVYERNPTILATIPSPANLNPILPVFVVDGPEDWRKETIPPTIVDHSVWGSKSTPGGDLSKFSGDILEGHPFGTKLKKDNGYDPDSDQCSKKICFIHPGRLFDVWYGVEITRASCIPECRPAMMARFESVRNKYAFRQLCRELDAFNFRASTRKKRGRPKKEKNLMDFEQCSNHGLKSFRWLFKLCDSYRIKRQPRGRPRKTPAPEPVARRPRGRPKKVQLISIFDPAGGCAKPIRNILNSAIYGEERSEIIFSEIVKYFSGIFPDREFVTEILDPVGGSAKPVRNILNSAIYGEERSEIIFSEIVKYFSGIFPDSEIATGVVEDIIDSMKSKIKILEE